MRPAAPRAGLLDFGSVLRNRPAMGYILGYGAHCFELYGLRTWIVAFWAFVVARNGGSALLEPVTVSFLVAVLAMPSSILGNEAALRWGRHRAIALAMLVSALIAVVIGLAAASAPAFLLALLLVYAITVPANSGALTSGMSASAEPAVRGATMAMHSTVGFGLSALGGWAVGVALDAGGGPATASGWLAGFLVMAVGTAVGPLALWWSRRGPQSRAPDRAA